MNKIFTSMLLAALCPLGLHAQGWPADYQGVMLQGFSWDSYVDTQWQNLESQAPELSQYFNLIWVPNSGDCNNSYNNMGYMPVYYFKQNSSFGTEAQLRSMIQTYKKLGTGIIADVVVNHRNVLGVNGSYVDFPAETYNDVTYQMQSTDITSNDDGGATKTWADKNGYSLGNTDTGEDWSGCRDLDHTSPNVQNIIKAYENYLLNDLGYTGFRYDMVKGFAGRFIKEYNNYSKPKFSVGEHWSSNSAITNWINSTDKTSAAFDFQFRYAVRDAANNSDWSLLGTKEYLANDAYSNGTWKQWAVTFVENHDMQDRGSASGYTPDPILKDTLAANAFLLAMPGTPCVFLPHWKAYKQDIKAMIDVRKAVGVSNTSNATAYNAQKSYYAAKVQGDKAQLLAVVGPGANSYTPTVRWKQVLKGYHYAYYIDRKAEMAWADKASGTYYDHVDVTLAAVSSDGNAQVVYTTDGSTPTAQSAKASNGQTITLNNSCTLKLGLLSGGTVTGIISRNYTIKQFTAHKATVYFKDPGWSTVYFYAWDASGELNAKWPGTAITATKTINGSKYYYESFDVNKADYTFNIIFNNGEVQTVDIGPVSADTYYELSTLNGAKYTVTDITSSVTAGINGIKARKASNSWYTLSGVRLNSRPTAKGIYIHQGKKMVVE